jgi:hypothetical protein
MLRRYSCAPISGGAFFLIFAPHPQVRLPPIPALQRRHPTRAGRCGSSARQTLPEPTPRPAGSSGAIVIVGERQLVCASCALLKCVVAIALEHELRRPPNVDLRDQSGRLMKSLPGPPMTLGNAANAKVRLIVWCKTCSHQVEPDPDEMARQYGAGTSVLDWRDRLVCSRCGGRAIDMVVTGTERRHHP